MKKKKLSQNEKYSLFRDLPIKKHAPRHTAFMFTSNSTGKLISKDTTLSDKECKEMPSASSVKSFFTKPVLNTYTRIRKYSNS